MSGKIIKSLWLVMLAAPMLACHQIEPSLLNNAGKQGTDLSRPGKKAGRTATGDDESASNRSTGQTPDRERQQAAQDYRARVLAHLKLWFAPPHHYELDQDRDLDDGWSQVVGFCEDMNVAVHDWLMQRVSWKSTALKRLRTAAGKQERPTDEDDKVAQQREETMLKAYEILEKRSAQLQHMTITSLWKQGEVDPGTVHDTAKRLRELNEFSTSEIGEADAGSKGDKAPASTKLVDYARATVDAMDQFRATYLDEPKPKGKISREEAPTGEETSNEMDPELELHDHSFGSFFS